jgi:formylglycine-generating enzyme required for sulfatase activity
MGLRTCDQCSAQISVVTQIKADLAAADSAIFLGQLTQADQRLVSAWNAANQSRLGGAHKLPADIASMQQRVVQQRTEAEGLAEAARKCVAVDDLTAAAAAWDRAVAVDQGLLPARQRFEAERPGAEAAIERAKAQVAAMVQAIDGQIAAGELAAAATSVAALHAELQHSAKVWRTDFVASAIERDRQIDANRKQAAQWVEESQAVHKDREYELALAALGRASGADVAHRAAFLEAQAAAPQQITSRDAARAAFAEALNDAEQAVRRMDLAAGRRAVARVATLGKSVGNTHAQSFADRRNDLDGMLAELARRTAVRRRTRWTMAGVLGVALAIGGTVLYGQWAQDRAFARVEQQIDARDPAAIAGVRSLESRYATDGRLLALRSKSLALALAMEIDEAMKAIVAKDAKGIAIARRLSASHGGDARVVALGQEADALQVTLDIEQVAGQLRTGDRQGLAAVRELEKRLGADARLQEVQSMAQGVAEAWLTKALPELEPRLRRADAEALPEWERLQAWFGADNRLAPLRAATEAAAAKAAAAAAVAKWRSSGLRPVESSGIDPQTGMPKKVVHDATGAVLVLISAGEFQMGSPEREEGRGDDERQHRRVIRQAFYLGETEVTQAQWRKVMGSNPSRFKGSDTLPVDNVNWNDCQEFVRKAGGGLRLPSEAEWEYACRAGTTTPFSFGATVTPQQANYDGNLPYGGASKGLYREQTVAAGSLPANAWGLHDMHGNVWEWCEDGYAAYPANGTEAPAQGAGARVLRGGSWRNSASYCRAAYRYDFGPGYRLGLVGLRLARTLPQ